MLFLRKHLFNSFMNNPSPVNYLAKFFPVLEKISLAAFIIGFALRTMNIPAGNSIVTIGLSTLAVIYFLTAQIPLETSTNSEQNRFGFIDLLGRTIAPKVLGIGSSVSVVGVQFTLLNWNGFREMLVIGGSSLAAATVVGLVASSNDEVRKALQPRLIRALPLMLICFYLLWVYGITDPTLYTH
jgi:hypothetical protein